MNNLSKSLFIDDFLGFFAGTLIRYSKTPQPILGPSKILQIAKSIDIDYKSIKVQRKSADLRNVYH